MVYKRTIEIWEKFKEEKLKEENKQVKLKGIGVTIGPGLSPCLWVGLSNARSISKELNIPIYAINHLEAHSLVVRLNNDVDFPFLLLLVSGGHTQLLLCHDVAQYTLLGVFLFVYLFYLFIFYLFFIYYYYFYIYLYLFIFICIFI